MKSASLVLPFFLVAAVFLVGAGAAAVEETKAASNRQLQLPEPLRLLGEYCLKKQYQLQTLPPSKDHFLSGLLERALLATAGLCKHLLRVSTTLPHLYAEKIGELMARGKEVNAEDLPLEVRELVADVDMLCELDRGNSTREGRGLLSKLSFLTGLHFGSLFHGSGTVAATQSLTLLGRIINSALSVSYGPSNGVVPSVVPAIPSADSVDEEEEADDGRRPVNFLFEHNRRVEDFNRRHNLTDNNNANNRLTTSSRQGRN